MIARYDNDSLSLNFDFHLCSLQSYEREAPTDAKLEANYAPIRLPLRLLKNFFALTESHDMMEEYAQQDFENLCLDGEWELLTPIIVK